ARRAADRGLQLGAAQRPAEEVGRPDAGRQGRRRGGDGGAAPGRRAHRLPLHVTTGLRLGAPGVYTAPRRPEAVLTAARLDIAGFAGVALRGPVNLAVPVTSWTEFERRFGGFERPAGAPDRLLPYAVQAFFGQSGERAYIARVVPPPDAPGMDAETATARFRIGSLTARAAD